MLTLVKAGLGLLATAAVGTGVVVAVSSAAPTAEQAVVTHLVDGDTFDVSIDGRTERIRMLNIDTPETKDPDEEVQCLGPEASAHLESLIPVGTPVTLEYDEERTDGYDRTLAGVFTMDGILVNAEMARAGLAIPVVFGGNDRFYPPVLAARDEAAAQGRGLFSPEVACTLPGQIATVATAVNQAPTAAAQPAAASSAELHRAAEVTTAALLVARTLEGAFAEDRDGLVWSVFTDDERNGMAWQVRELRDRAQGEATALRQAAVVAHGKETAAAAAERAAEEERRAREAEARRRAEAAPPPKPPARKAAPAPRSDPRPADSGSSANPYPGYTGPRCYAPGGKTWKPC